MDLAKAMGSCLAELRAIEARCADMMLQLQRLSPEPLLDQRPTHRVIAIKQHVCKVYDIEMKDLIGDSHRAQYVWPRHVAIHLAYMFSGLSTTELAPTFNRDHTSVIHARNTVKTRRLLEPLVDAEIKRLEGQIAAAFPKPTK